MNQYYLENFETPSLTGDEMMHCVHVMRHRLNDVIRVFDGKGKVGKAAIRNYTRKSVELEILEVDVPLRNYKFCLSFCLLKQKERNEWIIEKGTELGVTVFYPLISERTIRDKVDYERMRSLAIAAAKQSQNDFAPVVHKFIYTWELNCLKDKYESKVFGFCEEHEKKVPISQGINGKSILVVIGPEGDFTTKEADDMVALDFVPVSLGKTRLRAETASIMAASVVKNHIDHA